MKRLFIVVAVAAISFVAAVPQPALAARWTFNDQRGRFCDGNLEPDVVAPILGKVVCRDPRNYADFSVYYFDFDRRVDRVFTDCFDSTPTPGVFNIGREEVTFAQWFQRYGR